MGEGELRKVVTSEGLGVGERRDLRLLPAPTIISPASLCVSVAPSKPKDCVLSFQESHFRISSNMALTPLSIEQLSNLVASPVPPSQLFEILSQYESQACLIPAGSTSPETTQGDEQLLSLFYSSFFFAHVLTRQMLVASDVLRSRETHQTSFTTDPKPVH